MTIRRLDGECLEFSPDNGDSVYSIGDTVYFHNERKMGESFVGKFMCEGDAEYIAKNIESYCRIFGDNSDYVIHEASEIHRTRLLMNGVGTASDGFIYTYNIPDSN